LLLIVYINISLYLKNGRYNEQTSQIYSKWLVITNKNNKFI